MQRQNGCAMPISRVAEPARAGCRRSTSGCLMTRRKPDARPVLRGHGATRHSLVESHAGQTKPGARAARCAAPQACAAAACRSAAARGRAATWRAATGPPRLATGCASSSGSASSTSASSIGGWDYFAGMSQAEIERHRRADVTWHRPTWRFGTAYGLGRRLARRVRAVRRRHAAPARPPRRPPTKAEEMMARLGLEGGFTLTELKRRYKSWPRSTTPTCTAATRPPRSG